MKIYLDAMGGDNAPQAPVEGALEALGMYPQLEIELAGPIGAIEKTVESVFAGADPALRARLLLTDCPEVITNCEAPVMAVRKKKQSAIVDGMLKLRDGQVDAFVSAGSTGAVLSGGMFRLGRLRGIDRPALAPLLPNGKDFFLLIDCGANVDCRPEYLHQFAMMGKAYMQGMRGIENPRIGLVNNGAEAEKGCALTKEAYALLEADKRLNFVGNVEPREITHDQADVIVCDGFVGNVILKFMEGVAGTLMGIIKTEIMGDFKSKIGGLLAKPAFRRVKQSMDYSEVGGAPLLGVRGNVVKAHGSSNGHALACAIRQAVKMVEGGVVEKIEALLPKEQA
ncbi:MAG: phosphate acyltransferase PlsX [Clostridiales bacterium]|nr:phosphate acyltransferase PlsX [Clostridiales bacterium]MDO4349616.1 phosphate acyltransferase PlsX [Eubacteriales bacterium]MDY4009282.1 phosphate acyltransferase PlsX [Candidatus Limiplasma sp.]